MKKDLDKILSSTLKTYSIILIGIFILKLCGLDYFGLDTENKAIVLINKIISYTHLQYLWYAITLYINAYCIISITTNIYDNKIRKHVLYAMPIFIFFQYLKSTINAPFIFVITDFLYLFILSLCYIKYRGNKINKYNVINYILFALITIFLQYISLITRNIPIKNQDAFNNDFIINIILNIDYFILMIMVQKLYFLKGGKSLWDLVHSSSLGILTSLKNLPEKWLESYHKAKPKETDKETKLTYKIYIVLFWLYNIFTLFVIVLISVLNDTFIECLFIITSFWMNKKSFGKPFHLQKASLCFIVSSFSYYALNRLTCKIGISFVIPILLGIGLSYVTSKIMNNITNNKLYRGMDIDSFYETITKVTNNTEHINICKDFYINKEQNVKIAIKYNYSVINIKKIKQKINDKLKEL